MKATHGDERCFEGADLFYGAAGWGLASLKFFIATGNELYLDRARQAGQRLIATRRMETNRYYWERDGRVEYGLAHGASGIALFFLYLWLVTQQEEYLAAGRGALDFDLGHGVETGNGGLSWADSPETPTRIKPYWQYGSAGIGTTVLRYYRVLGDSSLRRVLDGIFADTRDRKYAVNAGHFMGLAGIGHFTLDLFQALGDLEYRRSAELTAAGIALFAVSRAGGTAYPGEYLYRITCDYGTGGAGVATFLDRLHSGAGTPFALDELLGSQGVV